VSGKAVGNHREPQALGAVVGEQQNEPDRVLVVVAHPDDMDFACGGTIAAWTAAGVTVGYCVITDGDAGGRDANADRSQVAATRRAEQRAAAAILGVEQVDFLGYPDGRLVSDLGLRRDITRVIRRFRPGRVVLPSPVRDLRNLYAGHPDHVAAGDAGLSAAYPDAGNPQAHPELLTEEGLEPHDVSEVWLMLPTEAAEHFVDITDTFDRKVAALAAHVSQTAHRDGLAERIRAWGVAQGSRAGFAEGRLAEGFLVLSAG
jgi:LmbE family N-acetylglucosaminyl deacetylase